MSTVDIILICYNQEQYIRQALQSIYAQELPKDVSARIIVADDCSTDDTLETIKHMALESPIPIIFLSEESNMGISKNYHRAFTATTADYVAILEGDDYWLPNHLKQHVEFLAEHPECSMSMNEITMLFEETGVLNLCSVVGRDEYRLVDVHRQISEGNQLGNLSACIFRGGYLRSIPLDLYDMNIADWMLGIMVARYGDIGILKGSTSVYREKSSGVWAGKSHWQQYRMFIHDIQMYDKYLNYEYHLDWLLAKKKIHQYFFRNWMHFFPAIIQNTWHKIKLLYRKK